MSICKFCLKHKKLVKAHIIPRAFFESLKDESGRKRSHKLKEFTNRKGRYPISSSTTGLYDQNLVCHDCEQIFGPFDNSAVKILLRDSNKHVPKYVGSGLVAWQVKSYDYRKLMLFFISLLWRADKSERQQFERIKIGPYSDIAKHALLNQKLEEIKKFSVLLARFEGGYGRKIIMDPYLTRAVFKGVNVYHFHLGAGYIAYIKVDQRPWPPAFEVLKLSPEKFYVLNRGKFEDSQDLSVIQKIYKDVEQITKTWRE